MVIPCVRRVVVLRLSRFDRNRNRCLPHRQVPPRNLRLRRVHAMSDSVSRLNGIPFEDPRSFFSGARDLMVNGFDLIEELSEVTIAPSNTPKTPSDFTTVHSVSYFGSPGAFCEAAAKEVYPEANLHPMDSWGGTIEDMLKGHCDRALIPIENHYTKRTRILYDLICKYNMHIVDEVFLNINHALLAKEGTKLSDIQVIASHIQGLFQCERYIVENFPNVRLERMNDTAAAAQMVTSRPDGDFAAIASHTCAEAYGLKVLKDNIQDRPDNVTRFVVLGQQSISPDPSLPCKTSILFGLPRDKDSGTLGQALEIFAAENINLLWLDSRELHSPLLQENSPPCHYLFYVNLEGSVGDERVMRALNRLEEISVFFRIMGSYKMKAKYLEDFFVPT